MRTPKIKKQQPETIAIVPMTGVKLQWTAHDVCHDGLTEGNPSSQFGVWMNGALLCMTPIHGVAVHIALLQAEDVHNVVDLLLDTVLLAGSETWLPWPYEPQP